MGVQVVNSGKMSALPQPFTVYHASGDSLSFYFGPALNLDKSNATNIVMELSYATSLAINRDIMFTFPEKQIIGNVRLDMGGAINITENKVCII